MYVYVRGGGGYTPQTSLSARPCSWFKVNNFRVTLGMALKFYTSVTKRLKLKVRKFLELVPTFVEVTEEKLVRGAFLPPPPSPTLNMVNPTLFSKVNLPEKLDRHLNS